MKKKPGRKAKTLDAVQMASKKWDNHRYALALYFATYNFVTPHGTLSKEAGRRTTPAMASGLTDHPWTLEELLTEATKSTQS